MVYVLTVLVLHNVGLFYMFYITVTVLPNVGLLILFLNSSLMHDG